MVLFYLVLNLNKFKNCYRITQNSEVKHLNFILNMVVKWNSIFQKKVLFIHYSVKTSLRLLKAYELIVSKKDSIQDLKSSYDTTSDRIVEYTHSDPSYS